MLFCRSNASSAGLSRIGLSNRPLTGTTPLLPKVGHPSCQVAGMSAGIRPIGKVSRKNMPCQSVPPPAPAIGTRLPCAKPLELSTPRAS